MLCQWIPPHIDPALADDLDKIKCGRPTRDRACPWCEEHLAVVFGAKGMSVEAVTVDPESDEVLVEDEDAA